MSKKKNPNKNSSIQKENEKLITVNETAINEYLEVVKNEYSMERDKKQSFENRAGIVLTMLGAISIFLFDKVKLSEIIDAMYLNITFFIFIKILAGIIVYIGFLYTIITIVHTLIIQKHDNFEVKSIDEELISEQREQAMARLIFTYRDIIIQHRDVNKNRAKSFRNSLYGLTVTVIAVIIYVSIN